MAKIAVLGYRLDGVRSGAHLTHLELADFLESRGHMTALGALAGRPTTRFGDAVWMGAEHLREIVGTCEWVMLRDEQRVGALLPFCGDRRILYTCHSPAGDPRAIGITLPASAILVWVSGAVADQAQERFGPYPGAQMVIEGLPIKATRYRAAPGERVTLVNLSLRKGGQVFWRLAARMPETLFLGVQNWGAQILPPRVPKNVRLMKRVADPRDIYSSTRVLLLPSAETGTVAVAELPAWGEAWNRCGIEAALSGIPAIAHPAAGIRASLGDAAVYVDRDDLEGWARELRRFDDPAYWAERSAIALARAAEIQARAGAVLDAYDGLIRRAA